MRRTPADGEEHARTWMAWRSGAGPTGTSAATLEALAHAIAEHEHLTVLCRPDEVERVRSAAPGRIETVTTWSGDDPTPPTFVIGPEGVGAVLHGQAQAELPRPRRWQRPPVSTLAARTGVPVRWSTLPLASVRSDGWGTALAVEPDLTADGRTHDEAERELIELTGALTVLWLPAWLGEAGAGRPLAAFAGPGVVLVHDQPATSHPDHAVTQAAVEVLEAARDSRGQRLRVVRVPAPARGLDDEGRPLHRTYLDHVLVNGAVVAPVFDDVRDDEAIELLAELHPERALVAVDARPLADAGYGLRSLTSGQPAERAPVATGARARRQQTEHV